MKKVLSILLVFTLIFTCSSPAFSASDKCNCAMTPVVYVIGFGDTIYSDTENKISAFPPEDDAIKAAIPAILTAVFAGLLTGNDDVFGKYAAKAANHILGDLSLNPDGTAPEGSGVRHNNNPSKDTHKIPAFATDENGKGEGCYKFSYDWRLSPIYNAKLLDEYIENVKKVTKHSQVVLTAHSQGNTIITSYLHLYGNEDIEKLVFLSPAYQGISLVGSLFKREMSVKDKGDALDIFLGSIMDDDNEVLRIVSFLNKIGVINCVLNWLQGILDSQLDVVYDESLVGIFGTMPGLWAFVPEEDYEQAKLMMFGDDDKYDDIVELTDYYYENVQTKTADILEETVSNGTEIAIIAGYDISSIPVTTDAAGHSDFLIDTRYMSLGATCSDIDSDLGEGYAQAVTDCGHNHVSPENTIDASTCAFPEYTWFVKGNSHNDFSDDYNDFIEWIIRFDGQPTVHSCEEYPQFIQDTSDGIVPVKTLR